MPVTHVTETLIKITSETYGHDSQNLLFVNQTTGGCVFSPYHYHKAPHRTASRCPCGQPQTTQHWQTVRHHITRTHCRCIQDQRPTVCPCRLELTLTPTATRLQDLL